MADNLTPTAEATQAHKQPTGRNVFRVLGLGLITGAADDDCSAMGTYASAGAKFGPAFLWTAPVTFPMMFAVVYLSAKLGQVSGKGLFAVIRDRYPKWILHSALVGVLIGNTIEAGADIGAIAAAINIFVPLARLPRMKGLLAPLHQTAPQPRLRCSTLPPPRRLLFYADV